MIHRTALFAVVLASLALGGCLIDPTEPEEEPIDSTEAALTAPSQKSSGSGQAASSDLLKTGARAGDQVGTGVGDVMNGEAPSSNPKPQPDPWVPNAPAPVGK